jgi:hypothetical protein
MQKAIQSGIVSYHDRLWQIPKPLCTIKEEFVSVDMDKMSPAFLIIGTGVVMAIIVLFGEIIVKRRSVRVL